LLQPSDKFQSSIGSLEVIKLLGKGKSAFSYLTKNSKSYYVLKLMHNEKVSYYDFKTDKTLVEVNAYNELKRLGIKMPKLYSYDPERQYLIKEMIEGPTAAEYICANEINKNIIEQLFQMSNILREAKLNIDFFPTNFVVSKKGLYYIDYEINEYSFEWSLENWGIYYWANGEGFKKFLETGDASFINSDIEKGIPIKEQFKQKINNWIEDYGNPIKGNGDP
jgi:predicted Ser/Thr protein kinase